MTRAICRLVCVLLGGYDRRSGGGYQDRRARDYGSGSYSGGGGGYRDRSRDYRSDGGRVSHLCCRS